MIKGAGRKLGRSSYSVLNEFERQWLKIVAKWMR